MREDEKVKRSIDDVLCDENIISKEELHKAIDFVFGKISTSVGKTLGPGGGLTFLTAADGSKPIYPTKDGFTVVQEYKFNDQIKYFISELVKDIPRRMNTKVGDGTTSGVIIGYRLYQLLSRYNLVNRHPEFGCEISGPSISMILEEIRINITKALNNNSDYILKNIPRAEENILLKKIATISANNDPEIGGIVSDLFIKRETNNVYITNEISKHEDTEVEKEVGFEFGAGFIIPQMANMPDRITCKLTNPKFIICDGPITENDLDTMRWIMDYVADYLKSPLVIIAKDFDNLATQFFAKCCSSFPIEGPNGEYSGVHQKEQVACLTVNGEYEKSLERLEDLRIILGCEMISTKKGQIPSFKGKHQDFVNAFIGGAAEFSGTQMSTRIKRGNGSKDAIMGQIKCIEDRIRDIEINDSILSFASVETHRKRIAMLNSDMTIIRIGGANDKEKHAKKLIYDDAVAACKSSIDNGITLGGNVCVVNYIRNNKENIINTITDKLLSENRHVIFRNSRESVFVIVTDLVNMIETAFKAAYLIAIENMVGLDTPVYNEILDEVYSNPETDKAVAIDLVNGRISTLSDEDPSPIVPGNTDTELMFAIFGTICNMISSNQLLSIIPGKAAVFLKPTN